MDTDLTGVIHEILTEFAAEAKLFFTNLVRSERMKDAAEYSDNPEEATQMDAEINATEFELEVEGSSLVGRIKTSGSDYDKVSTEGKPESYSGGQGGMVTLPNGEVVPSEVNPNFWGQPVPDSAEPPSQWKENATKMIQSLLPGQLSDFVKSRLGDKIAPLIGRMLTPQLTGGVA